MKNLFFSIVSISLLLYSCSNSSEHSHHKHGHHHTNDNKSNKHMNEASFDELSAAFESKDRDEWQKPDLVIKQLGDIKGKTIGDIGSGTGYFSFRLANQEAEVVAIDVDKRFIDFIKQKKTKENIENITTSLVGYDDPELKKESYDALIIVNTYHHFNNKIEYMTHCLNGLKKGGVLMNVDFKKKKTSHGPPLNHRISATEVKADLLKTGFTSVEIDQTTLPQQYIIIAKK